MNVFASKKQRVPVDFQSEPPLFLLVYKAAREDYATLRKAIFKKMRPLEIVGYRFLPWVNLLALPWLWSEIQTWGWTMATLKNSFFPLFMICVLGNMLVQQWRAKRRFLRCVEVYPHRALIVHRLGGFVIASDARGKLPNPPIWLYQTSWEEITSYENRNEHIIFISKGHRALLISNNISAYTCEVDQASRILDELLIPSVEEVAPIAEPK